MPRTSEEERGQCGDSRWREGVEEVKAGSRGVGRSCRGLWCMKDSASTLVSWGASEGFAAKERCEWHSDEIILAATWKAKWVARAGVRRLVRKLLPKFS